MLLLTLAWRAILDKTWFSLSVGNSAGLDPDAPTGIMSGLRAAAKTSDISEPTPTSVAIESGAEIDGSGGRSR